MIQDEQFLERLMDVFVDFSWTEALPLVLQVTAWASLSRTGTLSAHLRLLSQMDLSPQEQIENFKRVQPLISVQLTSASWKADAPLAQHLPLLIERVIRLEKQGLRTWCADDLLYWSSESITGTNAIAPSLATFLVSLATTGGADEIYLPWEKSGQLAARCSRKGIKCRIESTTPTVVKLILAQVSTEHSHVHGHDPVLSPMDSGSGQLKQFPVSLSILEQARRFSIVNKENDHYDRFPAKIHLNPVIALGHLLTQTQGKIVVVVPNDLLFSAGAERKLRTDLLHERMIHTVISLPDGLFSGTPTATSVLILDTVKRSDSVRFVKVTDEFTTSDSENRVALIRLPHLLSAVRNRDNNSMAINVAASDISPDDCNLEVSRYLADEKARKLTAALSVQPTDKLIDHFDLVRARQYVTTAHGVSVHEIQAADLPEFGYVTTTTKDSLFDLSATKALNYFVQKNDIVICVKGAVGKVGIVKNAPDSGSSGWVVGQSLAILRARPSGHYDPRAVMVYLRSPMGQAQLSRLTVGSSIPTIQGAALKELEIPTMNLFQQGMAIEALENEASIQFEIATLHQKQSQFASALWKL